MKSLFTVFIFSIFLSADTFGQQTSQADSLINKISDSLIKSISLEYTKSIHDSIVKNVKDSIWWESLKKTAVYPVIKNSEWSGAFPVPQVTEKADPAMKYRLLFNLTLWSKDSSSKRKINDGLAEIGRIINLHVAAGVPKENLELVVVVHGPAMNAFLKNEIYLNKFKTNNPNLDILKQFTELNTRLIACGQAELFFKIPASDMLPEVKTAYSAKVAISTYELKGYVLFDIAEDK